MFQYKLYPCRVSVSIPFASIYGYDIASDLTDPFIKGVGRALELGDPLLTPFSTLVNIIPSLSNIPPWVPGATTQKIAAEHRQVVNKLKTEPMKVVKEAMVSFLYSSFDVLIRPCFVGRHEVSQCRLFSPTSSPREVGQLNTKKRKLFSVALH